MLTAGRQSYPLDPVEAVNNEVRTPLYKQNVARNNSYNKYSGNYGLNKAGAGENSYGKRGMSLDRISRGRAASQVECSAAPLAPLTRLQQGQYGYGKSPGLVRAHSQANIGNSSSEDSYTSARPYSGLGYHNGNARSRKPSGGSVTGR